MKRLPARNPDLMTDHDADLEVIVVMFEQAALVAENVHQGGTPATRLTPGGERVMSSLRSWTALKRGRFADGIGEAAAVGQGGVGHPPRVRGRAAPCRAAGRGPAS